jgi:hypothetical protein
MAVDEWAMTCGMEGFGSLQFCGPAAIEEASQLRMRKRLTYRKNKNPFQRDRWAQPDVRGGLADNRNGSRAN